MSLVFVLKRTLQQWRSWGVLLLVSSLTTTFFSFGPLYLSYNNEVLLRYVLDNVTERERHLILSIFDAPFDARDAQTLNSLDFLTTDTWGYSRSVYDAERESYQIYAFDSFFNRIVTLVEGRLPETSTSLGTQPSVLEAVVTTTVAERAGLEVGTEFSLPISQAKFRIVGIVDVNDPEAYFWEGNRLFTTGAEIALDSVNRYDWGFAVTKETYETWLEGVIRSTNYLQYIAFDTDRITATNYEQATNALHQTPRQINAYHGGSVYEFGGLLPVLQRHQKQLQQTEGPIIFLSALIMLLMLYNVLTATQLASRDDFSEWGMLYSRGGNLWQLFQLRLVPALMLGIVSAVVGLWMSRGVLFVISSMAESGNFLIAQYIPLPRMALLLSGVAGFGCAAVLLQPILHVATWSPLHHNRARSRPVRKPVWVQYQIDKVMLFAGGMLTLRLYWIAGGNASRLFHDMVTSPGDVMQFTATSLSSLEAAQDPFIVIVPALFLTGGALLWLRIFSRLMHFVAALSSHIRSLMMPLAVWHIERNTGHYGQFALAFISTLAIGIASVSLQETQANWAWSRALHNTGGDIRLEFSADPPSSQSHPWSQFQEVTRYSEALFLDVKLNRERSSRSVSLVGVEPSAFAQMHPASAEAERLNTSFLAEPDYADNERIPALVSRSFADTFRGNLDTPFDRSAPPLRINDERSLSINAGTLGNSTIHLQIVGIMDSLPGLSGQPDLFVVIPQSIMQTVFNQIYGSVQWPSATEIVWIDLSQLEPSVRLRRSIEAMPSLERVNYAWSQYNEIIRQPMINTVSGLFLIGFWISMILNLINFAYYIVITTNQRRSSLSVLRALGWRPGKVHRLLLLEQAIVIFPASLIGIALGFLLAYLLLPFWGYSESFGLQIPVAQLLKLTFALLMGYAVMITLAGFWLNRLVISQTLRVGDE